MAKPFGTYFGVDTFDNIEEHVREVLLEILPVGTSSTEIGDRLESIGVRGKRWRETDEGPMAYEMENAERTLVTWRCFELTVDGKKVQYDLNFHLRPYYKRGQLYGDEVAKVTVSVRTGRGANERRPGDMLREYLNMPDDTPVDEYTLRDAILQIFPLDSSEWRVTTFLKSMQMPRDVLKSVSWRDKTCFVKLADPLMPGVFFHIKFTFVSAGRDLFRGLSVQCRMPIMGLTAQQEAVAAEYGSTWRAIALQTASLDREAATSSVNQFYKMWSQPAPEIVFCESPFQLILLPVLLRRFSHSARNLEQTREGLRARFEPRFGTEQWSRMETALWQSLAAEMDRGVQSLLRPIDFVGFPVPKDQGSTSSGDLSERLRLQLNGVVNRFFLQMCKEMNRETVVGRLLDLSSPPLAGLAIQLTRALTLQGLAVTGLGVDRWIPWWGPWRDLELNAVPCIRELFGSHFYSKQMNRRFDIWFHLQRSALAYSFFKNVCFVCDFPTEIHTDARDDMHNGDGPAIVFRDAYAAYAWHGVAVPRYVIDDPDQITIADIESERNIELRRVKLTRYGEGRYLEDTNSEAIDTSEYGTLYRKDVPNDEPLVMVQVVNSTPEPDGTRKKYLLRVPPDMRTAREAVAWSFGMPGDDYGPDAES